VSARATVWIPHRGAVSAAKDCSTPAERRKAAARERASSGNFSPAARVSIAARVEGSQALWEPTYGRIKTAAASATGWARGGEIEQQRPTDHSRSSASASARRNRRARTKAPRRRRLPFVPIPSVDDDGASRGPLAGGDQRKPLEQLGTTRNRRIGEVLMISDGASSPVRSLGRGVPGQAGAPHPSGAWMVRGNSPRRRAAAVADIRTDEESSARRRNRERKHPRPG